MSTVPASAPASSAAATQQWARRRFDVHVTGDPALDGLVGVALRRNPRRAHLLVSTVLGKHVPAEPSVVHGHGTALGRGVAELLGGHPAVVLGFAETATGLGHCVAEALAAPYLHSTRREVPGVAPLAGFEEEHSHATSHRLLPEDPAVFDTDVALVLVDDELSTGRTALNTLRALHRPGRARYVLATLVDLRGADDRAVLEAAARELGARIDVVALASGGVQWPAGFPELAAAEVAAVPAPTPGPAGDGQVLRHGPRWPVGVREGGRHGFGPDDVVAARAAAAQVAEDLAPQLPGPRVLVLGTEELMYAPLLIAQALAARGVAVEVSSSTRSPVHVVDEPGYPIRSAVAFVGGEDAEGGPGPRYAYNVAGVDDVVVVTDVDSSALVEQLTRVCARVHVVPVPAHRPTPPVLRGPSFGSYRADEVGWLLTDLSDVQLEAPTEEREEAIQSGGAHYAESLPVEFQPDAAYRTLFDRALDDSAARIAHAVGVVTEIVLHERGPSAVLASLARAGTPVGVLVRRWAAFAHGADLPHYALSIVRGRGIDVEALRHLAQHHEPGDVVFVDGWTGKGAIARELAAAVESVNALWGSRFDPALAVLADPGHCVSTFGTREDFLIPSACLNSTVSGLVSRTVLNPRILARGQYHGAKFYAELAPEDVSDTLVDAISARFADVADEVARDWPAVRDGERVPTWAGWAEVERLSEEYGIGDVTLVKPGVGETTRVLLRRVPWAVLVRPDAAADLAHVRLLAEQRGVPVHEVDGLTYSCVGLIHPRFTRGATGADGQAAARTP